jgi:PD-(D/E)XK endonuclease
MNDYSRNWERKSYRGEVDFFAVYSKDFGKVYLVPIDEFGDNRRGFLRVDQPNRGVLPSTRWAVDFEL